jgi:hypothetical protein
MLKSSFGSIFSAIGGLFKSLFGGGAGGGIDIGKILSTAVGWIKSFFADGGYVSGAGTGTSDSIPAMVSHGEYVMTAEKTAKYLPLLEAMRSGSLDGITSSGSLNTLSVNSGGLSSIPKFATGGLVQVATSRLQQSFRDQVISPVLNIHPDALNKTMREWLEGELASTLARR